MTTHELKQRYPRASAAFLKANADPERVCAMQPEPVERMPLVAAATREETRRNGPAQRFEIVFTIYSVRPCDWDGYDIKHLQDWIVTAGILPNDGWKTLSGRCVSKKAATKDEERTEVEIVSLP